MSSDYGFIVDAIKFSHSSTSTFENCPYSFKLMYIDALPRENNFYGEFGTLIHLCLEKYFTGELEAYELSGYYKQTYDTIVKSAPPPYPVGIDLKYKEQGQYFFDFFYFEKEKYDVLATEDMLEFDLNGLTVVARPDLVLKEKESKNILLYDYKTAAPFWKDKKTGKEITDVSKMDGYYKQMFIYTYALRKQKNIAIDEIALWFTRLDKTVIVPWSLEKETEAIYELEKTIDKIKTAEDFPFNNSNSFFCNNLCGSRLFCEFR